MLLSLNWKDKFSAVLTRVNPLLVVAVAVLPASFANAGTENDSVFSRAEPIPYSTVSQSSGAGIVKAKLACATERYRHGVLGDTIEAGCLVVEDDNQSAYQLDLPEHEVFEDNLPRIADVDGDGRNDVIVVRSDSSEGAALAVYSIIDGSLQELAATPPIGLSNRWLAPVGVADFNKDGAADVAYVQTPHIGGILKVWSIIDDRFQQIAQARGFSNHSIGATRVSTAKIVDYNQDGVPDIALPDQARNSTVWVTLFPNYAVLDVAPYEETYFD